MPTNDYESVTVERIGDSAIFESQVTGPRERLQEVNDGWKRQQDAQDQQRQRHGVDATHGDASLAPAPLKKSPRQNPNEKSYCGDTGERPRRFVKVQAVLDGNGFVSSESNHGQNEAADSGCQHRSCA